MGLNIVGAGSRCVKGIVVAVAVFAMALPWPANASQQAGTAATPLKKLTLEQLGDIEVTAVKKEPEEIWRTPAAIYVITREDIRRSGATSVPEVLRRVPGVDVARIDSNTWAVGIRGFASSFSKSVLVLIDGRNVYTPLFAGVNWRLQNVMLEDVDRIEVIRGPGGTVWGTNAVNGVINIITRNATASEGGLASLGGGNVDQGTGEFRYGGRLGPNGTYRAYGMAFSRGPEHHADHVNFDSWQLGQAGFRIDWAHGKATTATLQGDLYKGEIGELENIAYYSPPGSINVNKPEDVSGGNLLARWQRDLPRGSDIRVQAYYDRTYRLGSQLGETRNTIDLDFIHHLTSLPRQDFIWGLGGRWSPSDFVQVVATVDFEPHHQADNIYSAFVQDEFAVVRNDLWLTIGSKFEHNIYTGWESQPAARLTWTPAAHQTLWAAVTRAVRSPSRLDEDLQLTGFLTSDPLPTFLRAADNGKFISEKLLGYELGYRSLISPALYLDISTFHNVYNDLTSFGAVTASFESVPPPLRYVLTLPVTNGIKGNTDGLEISPDWRTTRWMNVKASYSYLTMALRNKPGNTDTATIQSDEGSSPRHQAALQVSLDLPHGVELDPAYRYVGKLPAQYPSGLPAEYVRAYSSADMRAEWRPAKSFALSVTGHNLLQPSHAEFGGDPGPLVGIKRSVYARLQWSK